MANLVRGTVYANKLGGLVLGSDQTTTVRQSNYSILQAGIAYAQSWNRIFDAYGLIECEIDSTTPLSIASSAPLTWRGSDTDVQIRQFNNSGSGVPVLAISDSSTSDPVVLDIDGMYLDYGSSQTGLTSACILVIGAAAWGKFNRIHLGTPGATVPQFPPYRCLQINSGGGGFFSNKIDNLTMWGAQQDIMDLTNMQSSGNKWGNVYMQNSAGGNYAPLAGLYINMGQNQITLQQKFELINCEWGSVANVAFFQSLIGLTIDGWHTEGITLTGANPSMALTADSNIVVDEWSLEDCIMTSAGASGTCSLVSDFAPEPSVIRINQFTWQANHSSQVNLPVQAYTVLSGGNDEGTFSMGESVFNGASASGVAGKFSFDTHMPTGSSQFLTPLRSQEYAYGPGGSRLHQAKIPVSANYTHYGQNTHSTLIVPAVVTSFTITLSPKMGATGTQVPPLNNVVEVIRQSGSCSGTLLVKDGAGTTLATNTTSGSLWFQFTGTQYVVFTPVT